MRQDSLGGGGACDAGIIAVGSEMLTPARVDTNSLFLTDQLNTLGVEVRRKVVVGDDRALLTAEVKRALSDFAIVILTGGLGPTEDDLTREAVAAALGRPLVFRQDLCDAIEQRFRKRGRAMAEINKRQAYVIEGAEALPNPNGTAAGQWVEERGSVAMLIPGPPGEMKPMFANECVPRLAARLPAQAIRTRFYRVTGMTESDLDQLIAPVYTKVSNPAVTILAAPYDIQVHLRARCGTEEEAERLLAKVGDPVEELLGARIFSRNGDALEAVIGKLLCERGATLAVAESCTGGMIAERMTSVPGSSKCFLGGFVAYSNGLKESALGVSGELLERFTAVSAEAAVAMAEGARARSGATYAISTTGEAGPESATGAPPGTVYIGIDGPGMEARAVKLNLPGGRNLIRMFASQAALDVLRRRMLGLEER